MEAVLYQQICSSFAFPAEDLGVGRGDSAPHRLRHHDRDGAGRQRQRPRVFTGIPTSGAGRGAWHEGC